MQTTSNSLDLFISLFKFMLMASAHIISQGSAQHLLPDNLCTPVSIPAKRDPCDQEKRKELRGMMPWFLVASVKVHLDTQARLHSAPVAWVASILQFRWYCQRYNVLCSL